MTSSDAETDLKPIIIIIIIHSYIKIISIGHGRMGIVGSSRHSFWFLVKIKIFLFLELTLNNPENLSPDPN